MISGPGSKCALKSSKWHIIQLYLTFYIKIKCIKNSHTWILKHQLGLSLCFNAGERPFKCTQCDKAFNQKSALQVHMVKHTGKKPFKCEMCSIRFTQKSNMKHHMKRMHGYGELIPKLILTPLGTARRSVLAGRLADANRSASGEVCSRVSPVHASPLDAPSPQEIRKSSNAHSQSSSTNTDDMYAHVQPFSSQALIC